MDAFTEVEEAFFRAGDQLSESETPVSYDDEPRTSWWTALMQWLFGLPRTAWGTSPHAPVPVDYSYESYELSMFELFDNEEYELYAMAA